MISRSLFITTYIPKHGDEQVLPEKGEGKLHRLRTTGRKKEFPSFEVREREREKASSTQRYVALKCCKDEVVYVSSEFAQSIAHTPKKSYLICTTEALTPPSSNTKNYDRTRNLDRSTRDEGSSRHIVHAMLTSSLRLFFQKPCV